MLKLLLVAAAAFPIAAHAQVTPLPADKVADQVGMNVHAEYFTGPYLDSPDHYTLQVQAPLIASGIRYVRVGPRAPSGDNGTHKAEFYARMQALTAAGLKLEPVIGSTYNFADLDTDYAMSGNGWFRIEGDNEPDLAGKTCSQIIARQQALLNAVQADPTLSGLKVVGPSLTMTNPTTWFNNCPTTSPPTLAQVSNIGNWHTYIHGKNPEASGWDNTYTANAKKIFPSEPIDATEFGYTDTLTQHSVPAVSQAIAARYMPRWVLTKIFEGWEHSYIHQIADAYAVPTNPNSGYGMIDVNGNAKPVWGAVQNLIAMFADPTHFTPTPLTYTITRVSGNTAAPKKMLFQKSTGQYLIALWLGLSGWNDSTYQPVVVLPEVVNVQLGTSAPSVTINTFNDDGTVSQAMVTPVNGLFQMTVTDHMQVLVF